MSRADLTTAIRRQLMDIPVDEQVGDLDEPPHVQLFLLRDGCSVSDGMDTDELQDDDVVFLERCDGGLIVVLLQDGTFSVRYFDNEDDIEDRWADLCGDLEGGARAEDLRACGDDDGDERRTLAVADEDDEDTNPDHQEDDEEE
jgi:hypothetical protein